jgi:predicted secreted hydrolase
MNRTFFLLALCAALPGCARHALRAIPEDAELRLPADEAPHANAQTEWWHVHADLSDTRTGEPLHVFAAFVIQRTDLDRVAGFPLSLAVNPFHAAYVQIHDGVRSWSADRYNVPDLWAARNVGSGLDLRHNGWRIAWEDSCYVLKVDAGPHAVELRLAPVSEPVFPGHGGVVELRPGQRHQWMQVEALRVDGRWTRGIETRWVEGTAFYKHQWGRLYNDENDGFEWFSLDLPGALPEAPPEVAVEARAEAGIGDEPPAPAAEPQAAVVTFEAAPEASFGRSPSPSSLSIAWLHEDGMRGVAGSRAWIADRKGRIADLAPSSLRIERTRSWHSARSRATWPTAWRIEGPGIDLQIESLAERQEIWALPVPMHVGPARARGSYLGQPVDTLAFVEQAGARVSPLRVLLDSREPR